MKTNTLITFVTMALAIASPLVSAATYQATGPVLELTDSKIVIQKDKEKWEFARTADTKVTGELKVGSKVTVEYSMTATSIEAKPDKTKTKTPAAAATDAAKDAAKATKDAATDAATDATKAATKDATKAATKAAAKVIPAPAKK